MCIRVVYRTVERHVFIIGFLTWWWSNSLYSFCWVCCRDWCGAVSPIFRRHLAALWPSNRSLEISLRTTDRKRDYRRNHPISKSDAFRPRCQPRHNGTCGVVRLHKRVQLRERHQPPRTRTMPPFPCTLRMYIQVKPTFAKCVNRP